MAVGASNGGLIRKAIEQFPAGANLEAWMGPNETPSLDLFCPV